MTGPIDYDALNGQIRIAEELLRARYSPGAPPVSVPLDAASAVLGDRRATLIFGKLGDHFGLYVTEDGGIGATPLLHARLTLRIRAAFTMRAMSAAVEVEARKFAATFTSALTEVAGFLKELDRTQCVAAIGAAAPVCGCGKPSRTAGGQCGDPRCPVTFPDAVECMVCGRVYASISHFALAAHGMCQCGSRQAGRIHPESITRLGRADR